jgi:hypothetical protein
MRLEEEEGGGGQRSKEGGRGRLLSGLSLQQLRYQGSCIGRTIARINRGGKGDTISLQDTRADVRIFQECSPPMTLAHLDRGDVCEQFGHVIFPFGIERSSAQIHLVHHDAKSPEIHRVVIASVEDEFRCQIF